MIMNFFFILILVHLNIQHSTTRYQLNYEPSNKEYIYQMNLDCLLFLKKLSEMISNEEKIRIRNVGLKPVEIMKTLRICMEIQEYYFKNRSALRNG